MKFPTYHIVKFKNLKGKFVKVYTGPSINSFSVAEFYQGESIQIEDIIIMKTNEKWATFLGLNGQRRFFLLPSEDEYSAYPPIKSSINKDYLEKECQYRQRYEYGCLHWQGNPFDNRCIVKEKCWLCEKGSKLLSILIWKNEEPNETNIKKYCMEGEQGINKKAQLGNETKQIQAKSIACLKGRTHFVYIENENDDMYTFNGFDPQIGKFYYYQKDQFDYCYPLPEK